MNKMYFVNVGISPSHIKIKTIHFKLLRQARRFIKTIDTTERRSQCWQLVRVTNYGKFLAGEENLKSVVIDYSHTEYGV